MVICKMRYLFICAFILERVSSTLDCVSPVDSCPCSSEDWGRRASIFNCTGLNYTCMLTINNTLAEACIPDYPVKPGALGCPFFQSCFQSIPIIAIESEFKPCPPNKTECPDQNHTGYSLTRLYEYRLCIRKNSTTCSERSIHPFNENKIDHLPIILGSLFGSLFLVLVLVGIFFYVYRRRRRKPKVPLEYSPFVTRRTDENLVPLEYSPFVTRRTDENLVSSESDEDLVSLESDPFLRKRTDEDRVSLESVPFLGKPLYKELAEHLINNINFGNVDDVENTVQRIKESAHTEMSTVLNYNKFEGVPLIHAVLRRNIQMVDILLREGADFERLNEEDENAIQYGLFGYEEDENAIQYGLFGYEKSVLSLPEPYIGTKATMDFLKCLLEMKDKYAMDGAKFHRLKFIIEKALEEYKEIPQEIIDMGPRALDNYRRNIKKGALPSNYIRCMVVGHYGVGKTTLVRGMLGKNQSNIQSTDGIEVYREMCYIKDGTWIVRDSGKSFHTEDIFGLDDVIQVDFWDFAGQAIYYSTHPTYFSDRCLYLLVINAALCITDEVDDLDMDPSRISRRKVIDFLHYWIGNILHYSGHTKDGYPRIIVIGTHRDMLEQEMQLRDLERDIDNTLRQHIETGQVIFNIANCIDAKKLPSEDRRRIQRLIEDHGKTYPNFMEKIPKSWIDIQRKLRSFKDDGVPILSMTDFETETDTLGIPMEDEDVSLFLKFYTSLGQILYFTESTLKSYIILEPMWLINAMKFLITKEENLKKTEMIGKISKEEIQTCLRTKNRQYIEYFEHVIRVLDRLDLVCNPKTYGRKGDSLPPTFYYIPSIFKESGLGMHDPKCERMEKIMYSFEEEILPPAVYHRLVCSFLSTWTVHEQHLYCETVQFQLQDDILVRFRREESNFVVTIYVTQERSADDISDVTKRVFFNVLQACNRIIKSYTRSSTCSRPKIHYGGEVTLSSIYIVEKEASLFSSTENIREKVKALTTSELSMPLTDIHLVRICMYLTLDEQKDLFQRLPRYEIRLQGIDFNIGQKFLLALNELRTSVLNKGADFVAESLSGTISDEVINMALNHHLPKVDHLPDAIKSRQVTDQFLDGVAIRIGAKYFLVGVNLGLEIDEVIVIVNDNQMETLKINQKVLRTWKRKEQSKGGQPTYGTLASVFVDAICRIDDFLKLE